jgi:hypothetical protein
MGVFYVVDSENGLRVIAAPVCQTLLEQRVWSVTGCCTESCVLPQHAVWSASLKLGMARDVDQQQFRQHHGSVLQHP